MVAGDGAYWMGWLKVRMRCGDGQIATEGMNGESFGATAGKSVWQCKLVATSTMVSCAVGLLLMMSVSNLGSVDTCNRDDVLSRSSRPHHHRFSLIQKRRGRKTSVVSGSGKKEAMRGTIWKTGTFIPTEKSTHPCSTIRLNHARGRGPTYAFLPHLGIAGSVSVFTD